MKKFGDKFFVNYMDDNLPYINRIYWLKPLDPLTKVDDYKIEVLNYLYAFPPYPLPAINEVRSLIYWDMSLDIDKDEINVYDIYGFEGMW